VVGGRVLRRGGLLALVRGLCGKEPSPWMGVASSRRGPRLHVTPGSEKKAAAKGQVGQSRAAVEGLARATQGTTNQIWRGRRDGERTERCGKAIFLKSLGGGFLPLPGSMAPGSQKGHPRAEWPSGSPRRGVGGTFGPNPAADAEPRGGAACPGLQLASQRRISEILCEGPRTSKRRKCLQ
jgi:hypothetical protein